MPAKRSKENKNIIRIIILAVVGIVAFVVSTYINIVGLKSTLQKAPDSSGIAIFSVRETNILGGKTETKVDGNTGKVVEEDILVNAVPVIQLINSKWDRMEARFSGYEIDSYGNAVFNDGYTMYCNGMYVYNIVFNTNYQKEILGHIKIGTDFDTIEAKLGTPTFRRDDCIGYKTREVYIFFYDDEISIYPNREFSNVALEKKIGYYADAISEEGRTRFLLDIKNEYNDFTVEASQDEDVMILKSITRQIVLKLDSLDGIEVELYNGYSVASDKTKEYIEETIYEQKEEDLIDVFEIERKSQE